MSCVFCDIAKKEAPADIFYEDDEIIVFHDRLPRAPTHLLICPKEHYVDLLDVPPEVLTKMHEVTKIVARRLGADTGGFRLQINNGSPAGQIIFHLHFHFTTSCKLK